MISTNVSTKNSLKSTLYHLPKALHQKTGFFVGWKDTILYLCYPLYIIMVTWLT